jgi:hypothetical protein
MTDRLPIVIEVDQAESHRLCAVGGPFQAMIRLACQSYMDPTETCDRFIDYARQLESTGREVTHFLKIDTLTWAYVGRTADGGTVDGGSTAPLISMSEGEFVQGYERGWFDPKWASAAAGWQVPEFQRVQQALGLIRNAGLRGKIVRYIDFEGGANAFDPTRRDMNGRIVWRLLNSAKFRARMDSKVRPIAPENLWDGLTHTHALFPSVYPAVQRALSNAHNQTVYAMLADNGPFFLPNASAPTKPCPRFDGRPQIGTTLAPGQMNNQGWYMGLNTFGHYGTAAFVAAQDSYTYTSPMIGHHQLDSDPQELSARLRFSRGPSVLFSETGDLSKLAPLANLIGLWRN